jgi:PTS system mannose-specific IIC component
MIDWAHFVELIPLALLGGVLGLDVVSFPQAMISRPLVASTMAGALIGEAPSGLLLGAALELIALETLPFGASRYPEWGSASVVGGAIFATYPSHPAGSMPLAVLSALATTWVGGWTMVKLRQRNAVWAGQKREALEAGARGSVVSLQLRGMTADFFRGAALTVVAYALLAPLAAKCIDLWSADARISRCVIVTLAASVAGGAAWKLFHSTAGARWFFIGGLAVGLFMLFLR